MDTASWQMSGESRMAFPFSFAGVISAQHYASRDEVSRKLCAALLARGAHDVRSVGDNIEFRGITNYMSISPLTDVVRGAIQIDDHGSAPSLSYEIVIQQRPFIASLAIALAGLVFIAIGVSQFGFFAVFGGALLVWSCVYSLIIRVRFPRWLRKVLTKP